VKKVFRKRVVVVLGTGALLLGVAGAAFAYFSSTGTGTGQATVGASTAFTVASVAPTGGLLYPDSSIGVAGGTVDSIGYTVTNPGKSSQNLNRVVISISSVTGGSAGTPACTAGDFSLNGAPVGTAVTDTSAPIVQDLPAGGTATSSVTIEMIDNHLNQDACQNAIPHLLFSAS
jgi:hypothetical protein